MRLPAAVAPFSASLVLEDTTGKESALLGSGFFGSAAGVAERMLAIEDAAPDACPLPLGLFCSMTVCIKMSSKG